MKTMSMNLLKIVHSIPLPLRILLVVAAAASAIVLFSLTAKADDGYDTWCDGIGTCWVCSVEDCNGGGGYVNTFVTDIAANPSSITSGANSTISWNTSAMNSNVGDISAETACAITPTIGSVPSHGSGSRVVSPTTTTTYTLTCTWHHEFFYAVFEESQSNAATVTVAALPPAPTAGLTASPTTIVNGASTTLTWSSTNAASCTGTNFSTANATSGSLSVSPSANTTYSVSCTGTGGTANAAASVSVTAAQCSDGIDNDGNTVVDLADPGCTGPTDNTENGGIFQCSDHIDNDTNGFTDYPADTGCTSAIDNTELGGSCSGTKTGTITASPTRVNGINQTTTLTWSAQHITTSCVISGPGVNQTYPAASCAVTSTPLTTPVVTTQSIYRLTCDGTLLGTAIVNVVPKIEEF